MDLPSSSNAGNAGRRTHLKRLSLSVTPSQRERTQLTLGQFCSPMTPEKSAGAIDRHNIGSTSISDTPSPLSHCLGPGSSRRQRQRYGGANANSQQYQSSRASTSNTHDTNLIKTSEQSFPQGKTAVATGIISEEAELPQDLDATFTPSNSLSRATTQEPSSGGKRNILGRSPHARRQGSISYARSPSLGSISGVIGIKSPSKAAASGSGSSWQPAVHSSDGEGFGTIESASSIVVNSTSIRADCKDDDTIEPIRPESASMGHSSSSASYNELNVGIGARSADLLTFIAKKERKCLDLREELKRHEEELAILKKKWEAIIQREMLASQTHTLAASSSAMTPSHSAASDLSPSSSSQPPLSSPSGLFSTLTSSLTASATPLVTSTASASIISSPSNIPPAINKRLLTMRHSISVPSAQLQQSGPSYFSGAIALEQDLPKSSSIPHQDTPAYDMSKMAKSWLGGMMKSASSVLETLAPPPANDLGTVKEEEEPEEQDDGPSPSSSVKLVDRRTSNATATTSSSSPSSSFDESEEGRFSSRPSTASSVSSLGSEETVPSSSDCGDTTPIATPILSSPLLSHTTPKGSDKVIDSMSLWDPKGFEGPATRERREKRERKRLDTKRRLPQKTFELPSKTMTESESIKARPTHGKSRSTAFELGGSWGYMVGKKWNELASSETFMSSKRATLNFVDTVEKTLVDAITVDSGEGPDSNIIATSAGIGEIPEHGHHIASNHAGPGSWTELIGLAKTASDNHSENWEHQAQSGDMGEASISHSFGGTSREGNKARQMSLLEDDENDIGSTDFINSWSQPMRPINPKKGIHTLPLASSTVNLSSSSTNTNSGKQPSSAAGLGLQKLNEHEKAEMEESWGW